MGVADNSLECLSVVVLSYNRKDELQMNLPYLCDQAAKLGYELIIVDNASTDGSKELLKLLMQQHQNIHIILNDENMGVAEGRNTGLRVSKGDYVLHLDDDTRLTVGDMRKLCRIMDDRPKIGVVSPRILHAETGLPQNDHGEHECEVGNYHGACHLVRRSVLSEVGNFDPLCTFGAEELDYSIRVRVHGYGVLYAPNVVVKHNNYHRKGKEGKWRRRMTVQNFSRLNFKHFPFGSAALFTFRCLLSHLVSGGWEYGFIFALSLPKKAILGAMEGRRQHMAVPRDVQRYYKSHRTRPDFGNIPLYMKACKRLRQYNKNMASRSL